VLAARLVQTTAWAPAAPKLVAVTAPALLSCALAGSPRLRAGPAATFSTATFSWAAGLPARPETTGGLAVAPVLATRIAAAASTPAARKGTRLAR
jgi:hypothetical protein